MTRSGDRDPTRTATRGTSMGFDGADARHSHGQQGGADVADIIQPYRGAGFSQREFAQATYFEAHDTGMPTGETQSGWMPSTMAYLCDSDIINLFDEPILTGSAKPGNGGVSTLAKS